MTPKDFAQLVARISSHLRARDVWMAENKKTSDLLGQVWQSFSPYCAV